jgi:hypothetical protein
MMKYPRPGKCSPVMRNFYFERHHSLFYLINGPKKDTKTPDLDFDLTNAFHLKTRDQSGFSFGNFIQESLTQSKITRVATCHASIKISGVYDPGSGVAEKPAWTSLLLFFVQTWI